MTDTVERRNHTIVLRVDPHQPDREAVERAARIVRQGGLVAFPTETVYGLGANALDEAAVRAIFAAKDRPLSDPLIVHIAEVEQLADVARDVPSTARALIQRFWPGPLTLVLQRSPAVPPVTSAGLDTVAVRMPSHPVALALIRAAGTPIAAPSANRFGHTSPTTADHVLDDLAGRIDAVLDAGPTPVGVESTVLDVTVDHPTLLRPGGVTFEQLAEALGFAPRIAGRRDGPMKSPGLLDRHYAPLATFLLVVGPPAAALREIRARALSLHQEGRRVGILALHDDLADLGDLPAVVEDVGRVAQPEVVAQRLYAALRRLDRRGVDVILARSPGQSGLWRAIHDRLTRAAAGGIVEARLD